MSSRTGDSDALAERVANEIRAAIVTGDLKAGDRIVERKLGVEMKVSRTPIREALKLLRADGLIELSRNKGARVTGYSSQEALDLFDVIAALEGIAAERMARAMTPAHLAALDAIHAEMTAHYHNRDLDPYFAANSAAHDYIIAHCGNAALIESHGRLSLRARRGRYMAIMDGERWRQAVGEHAALMAAFRSNDWAAAGRIWSAHLQHTGASVAAALIAAGAA